MPVLDSGETDSDYVLVMPRADKSLRTHLGAHGKLNEADAVSVLRDIAAALEDLDGHVVHRDLKPENVLYLHGFWCLADFGISRYAEATTAEDTRKYSMTGPYAAPEQWRFERATAATDVYALGIMAYEMLAGVRPFAGPDFRDQHLHEVPRALKGVSGPLGALVDQCLHKEPGHDHRRPISDVDLLQWAGKGCARGSGRLQQAHHDAVIQQAESQSVAARAETARERQERLSEDARRSSPQSVRSCKPRCSTPRRRSLAPLRLASCGNSSWGMRRCASRSPRRFRRPELLPSSRSMLSRSPR